MLVFADTPSMGLMWGLPIAIAFAAILTISIVVALIEGFSGGFMGSYGWGWPLYVSVWGSVVLVIVVLISLIAFYPFGYDYHHWVTKQGNIEQISSRFLSAGDGGTNQRYVVVLQGGHPYGVDDTRASLLKEGDFVSLSCKKEYVYGSGSKGWGCNWNYAIHNGQKL